MQKIEDEKNVLFYFNSLAPSGGTERVIVNLVNSLIKENIAISVFVKDAPNSFYALDTRVTFTSINVRFNMPMQNRFTRFLSVLKSCIITPFRLKKELSKKNYDAVIIAHPLNLLEIVLAGVPLKKIIATEHGAHDGYNIIYKIIKKLLYTKAFIYIVPTKFDHAFYSKLKYPAFYLPHLKTNLNFEQTTLETKTVLHVGRFTADKQQLSLLKIWEQVYRKHPEWKLIIVGSGELESDLKNYVLNRGLTNSVQFLPPQKTIENLYKKASIFCLTSRYEGFGMVLLEALSFGVPCIAFDCPSGPRDIIKNEETGFLVEQDNLKEFQEKLEFLILNNDKLKSMSENAIKFSQSWSNLDITQSWIKILKRVNSNNQACKNE